MRISTLFFPASFLFSIFLWSGRLGPEIGRTLHTLYVLLDRVLGLRQTFSACQRLVQLELIIKIEVERVLALHGHIVELIVVFGTFVEFLSVLHLSDLTQYINALLQLLLIQRTELEDLPMQGTKINLFKPFIEVNCLVHERL